MLRSPSSVLRVRTFTRSFSSSSIVSPNTSIPLVSLFSGPFRRYNYPKAYHRAMSSDIKSQLMTYEFMEYVENVWEYRIGGFHPTYIGDTLKDRRYRVVHKLGYGGYSTTWLALDTWRQQYVAIKICSADSSEDSVEEHIFQKLSNTAQESLTAHPGKHLVQSLVDTFNLQGPNGHHKCLVMPPAMMSVRDAKEASYGRLFRPETARSIIAQLALAIDFVHRKGIVHGDIHMGNVFFRLPPSVNNLTQDEIYQTYGKPRLEEVVRVDGKPVGEGVPSHLVVPIWMGKGSERIQPLEAEVVLSDFGESFTPASVERFYSNSPLSFRPPEARFPSKPLDFSADIWSLACLAWEILGTRPLFESWVATDDEVLADEVDLLGKLPPEWWTQWDARSTFYTEDGESDIRLAPGSPRAARRSWSERLEGCIQRPRREADFHIVSEDEWTSLLAMLLSMLLFEPDQRTTAKELLQSDWMKDWAVCKTNLSRN
ncbi:kinase-like protein [Nemania sp. FL0031]|nr:kinase-like protein [Nemania sp. FL0031]